MTYPMESAPKDGTAILIKTESDQWFHAFWHKGFEIWSYALTQELVDETGACTFDLAATETLVCWAHLPTQVVA